MFQRDKDEEVIPETHDPIPQYHEPGNGLWWSTPSDSPMRAIEDHSTLAASSNFQPDSEDASSLPYMSNPPTLANHWNHYSFISSTEDEEEVPGTSMGIEAQNTISPRLLSNDPSSQHRSRRTRRKSVEPGLVQGSSFHPYSSQGALVSPLVNDIASSYASPVDSLDPTKKRKRRYTTIGQYLNLDGIAPNQPHKTGDYLATGTTMTAESEHACSPPLESSSLPPHSLHGISTISDDSTSSAYSATSDMDEQEEISPTDHGQLHSWMRNLPLELRSCYDEFITRLHKGESIEVCQKVLAPFCTIVTKEVEEDSGPLSTNEQKNENDTEIVIPTDVIAQSRDAGGVESREGTGSHSSPKRKRRYIVRQCRLCSHMLRHQLQMYQHIMDHFGIFPFHCQEQGCSFSSTRKADLTKHIADQHEMTGGSICSYCHEVLKHKRNLRRHIKSKHPDATTAVMASPSASV